MSGDLTPWTPSSDPDHMVGQVIQGCRIEAEIGRGGMGVVYRAEQLRLGRKVALKLLSPGLTGDQDFRRRFERESRIAASMEHPHATPVYEAGETDGRLFILMRYVSGTDLGALIAREGGLDPARAARILDQVGSALDAAHSRGLVHRDVKPANVLLTGEGAEEHTYLSDFGLTKDASSQSAVTHTGQWVGTVDYVAPEQLDGRPIDARTDVYALGCLLFEALSGEVPHPGPEMATMWAHMHKPPRPLGDRRPDLAMFDPVVARAMAKEPADRYPSAGDLGRAVGAAAQGGGRTQAERSVAIGAAAPGPGPPVATAAATRLERVAPPDTGAVEASAPSSSRGRRVAVGAAAGVLLTATLAGSILLGAWLVRATPEQGRTTAGRSSGPSTTTAPTVAVPSVIGGTADSAEAKLRGAGFEVKVVERFGDEPAGKVVDQTPPGGEELEPGSGVSLVVSKGPAQEPLTEETALTTTGLGRVRVGMTEAEAEAATGDELYAENESPTEGCSYLKVRGLSGVSFMLADDEIARVDVSEQGVMTKSGIGIGSSSEMVARAYGDRVEATEHEYNPSGEYLTFVPNDPSDSTRIVFETSDEQVSYMRAGRKPEVELIEGCA